VAKFGMGIIHGDGNTRQCMATAATAYKQAFGFDAPPFTYKDYEETDTMIFVGANPAVAHPIMWNRVKMNKNSPKIVVIDPRRTKTAEAATHHYPLAPQSDLTLLYTVANLLIQRGAIQSDFIANHTNGFEAFRQHVAAFTLERGIQESGLSSEQITELADLIAQGQRVSFWWTMGVNQSHQGVKVAQAMINIALMTGNIGRPGTGANSITGQANAMGSRIFSNTTNLLGGRDFTNPTHRQTVADILGIDETLIPRQGSLPYNQILDQVKLGKIKALWVIATNPAHSWIHQHEFNDIMDRLDLLVVQDLYPNTATAKLADLYLPAGASAEKTGFFINSERRLGHLAPAMTPPGDAKTDYDIFLLVAKHWGCAELFKSWQTPADALQVLKKLSAGQPCDITGIRDHSHLEEKGGIQWPCRTEAEANEQERRLYADGRFFHPDGKAKFLFREPQLHPEQCSDEFPFWLMTGRGTVGQWHTQTRTGKAPKLKMFSPEQVYVEIHTEDALRLAIENKEVVLVETARGQVNAVAEVSNSVPVGKLFMPMHYEETNRLTYPAFDPESFQPAFKSSAARIRKLS